MNILQTVCPPIQQIANNLRTKYPARGGGRGLQNKMSIRQQIRPVLTLALPLILAELGWMSMGIVDTVMVGHMANPALAISSAALGQVLYNTIAFGIAGILLGLDT
jgi:Na+-driven multidrug efflux pump